MTKRTRPAATTTARRARPLDAQALCEVRGGATYQKIEWTWNDGGITAEDEWVART